MSTYTDASLIITPNAKKASKLYALKGADLDVVRATTATYVGSDGLIKTALANEPRFDYSNGSCPSILVEPQRTNLALRSEGFDNATWEKTASTVTANATTSPSGTMTADKIIETTASSIHSVSITVSFPVNTVGCISLFCKKSERSIVYLGGLGRTPSQNEGYVWFDLNNGTVLAQNSGYIGKIEYVGNEWYRISVVTPLMTSSVQKEYRFGLTTTNGIQAYTGDGTSGVFIWGAQLEVGANATSYIPTVASTVTRNSDVISKSGISSLIGQTEGTIFADLNFNNSSSKTEVNRIIELTDGTNTNRIIIAFGSVTTLLTRVTANNIEQASFQATSISLGRLKVALSYSTSGVRFFVNGTLRQSNLSATIPSTNRLNIGYQGASTGSFLTDTINSALVFPTQLTDQECIALTTL